MACRRLARSGSTGWFLVLEGVAVAVAEESLKGIKRNAGVRRDQLMVVAATITNVISFLLLIIN